MKFKTLIAAIFTVLLLCHIFGHSTFAQIEGESFTTQLVALPDPLLVGNGSVGAPAIGFTSNPDMGIYRINLSEIAWTINSSGIMKLTSNYLQGLSIGDPMMNFQSNRHSFYGGEDCGIEFAGADSLEIQTGSGKIGVGVYGMDFGGGAEPMQLYGQTEPWEKNVTILSATADTFWVGIITVENSVILDTVTVISDTDDAEVKIVSRPFPDGVGARVLYGTYTASTDGGTDVYYVQSSSFNNSIAARRVQFGFVFAGSYSEISIFIYGHIIRRHLVLGTGA
jgi:hypothetical protein